MKSSEAIKSILADDGRSMRSLAAELGITPQALDSRLKSGIKVDTLHDTISALGYKVAIVPDSIEVPGYTVEG